MVEMVESLAPLSVFAYGTLKPRGTYWKQFCEGRVKRFVPAKTRGCLYALNVGYPALVSSNEAHWVLGFMLELVDTLALEAIDELEGYDSNRPSMDNEYNRMSSVVYSLAGKQLGKSWVYHMEIDKVKAMGGVFLKEGEWNERIHSSLGFSELQS